MWLRVIMVIMIVLGYRSTGEAQTCLDSIKASTPDSAIVDNGDSTVSDTRTGLMWKQCIEGFSGADCTEGSGVTYTWREALLLAESINAGGGFAGHADWRLPNSKELASIVELKCYDPAINSALFPNQPSFGVWTSSVYAGDSSSAWGVQFSYGQDYHYSRSTSYYVRLVRGGE